MLFPLLSEEELKNNYSTIIEHVAKMEVGSQRFIDLFEMHAEIINYFIQHEAVLHKVVADVVGDGMIQPVTKEIATKLLGKPKYNLQTRCRHCST
jgi:hypothetical protein